MILISGLMCVGNVIDLFYGLYMVISYMLVYLPGDERLGLDIICRDFNLGLEYYMLNRRYVVICCIYVICWAPMDIPELHHIRINER